MNLNLKSTLNIILSKLDLGLRRRTPIIYQTESSECGLACLAMVCAFHGKNIDLISLRQQFNLSGRGTTLASLNWVAEQLGMSTRALSLDLDECHALQTPCILHWNFNHFVVLTKIKNKRFVLHDPSCGRRSIGIAEMSQYFTGVALEIWPAINFKKEKVKKRITLSALMHNVHGLKEALAKIFCLSIIIEAINLVIPIGTQLVMDHVITSTDKGLLFLICTGLIFFILLRASVSMIRAWSALVIGALINIQWQSGLFLHLLRLPLDFFERRKLGDIQARFGSLSILRNIFTNSVVGAIIDGVIVIGLLIMLILYGGWLSGIVLIFTTAYVIIRLLTYSYYRQLSEESLFKEARASSYFMETLYGIATIKMQGMIERRSAHWLNLKIDAINTGIRVTKMDLLFGGINIFIAACDQIAILWFGSSSVIDNQMTVGMFVAFGSFREQFSNRIAALTNFLLQLNMISLHNERVADIALHESQARKPNIAIDLNMRQFILETQDLSYRYDSQSDAIFSNLTIRILPGESVAITGPSGAGKTTLMKVLCGLFEPTAGHVMIDNIDIQHFGINNYHKMIACVMQDDRIFAGSIRENICSFIEDFDENWMIECATLSYLNEVIIKMPMGYETLIGELGEGLSGGQKQRLFIARALYKKPGILFMDEATSALDNKSELFVNRAIKQLNITRVIIAHRESTIQLVDRVICLT